PTSDESPQTLSSDSPAWESVARFGWDPNLGPDRDSGRALPGPAGACWSLATNGRVLHPRGPSRLSSPSANLSPRGCGISTAAPPSRSRRTADSARGLAPALRLSLDNECPENHGWTASNGASVHCHPGTT